MKFCISDGCDTMSLSSSSHSGVVFCALIVYFTLQYLLQSRTNYHPFCWSLSKIA